MSLKVYLATINMTLKDFCALIEYNYRYMSRVMNGRHRPGKRLKKEIEKITDGQVVFSGEKKAVKN